MQLDVNLVTIRHYACEICGREWEERGGELGRISTKRRRKPYPTSDRNLIHVSPQVLFNLGEGRLLLASLRNAMTAIPQPRTAMDSGRTRAVILPCPLEAVSPIDLPALEVVSAVDLAALVVGLI